jgi:hypothetical protein
MLTGIAKANEGADDVIDVSLREAEKEIVISIRDMGTGFNPTVRDPQLDYEFDNAAVLNRIASNIEFDRSLGMNATRIRPNGLKRDGLKIRALPAVVRESPSMLRSE